jgi:hypothetical protein
LVDWLFCASVEDVSLLVSVDAVVLLVDCCSGLFCWPIVDEVEACCWLF